MKQKAKFRNKSKWCEFRSKHGRNTQDWKGMGRASKDQSQKSLFAQYLEDGPLDKRRLSEGKRSREDGDFKAKLRGVVHMIFGGYPWRGLSNKALKGQLCTLDEASSNLDLVSTKP